METSPYQEALFPPFEFVPTEVSIAEEEVDFGNILLRFIEAEEAYAFHKELLRLLLRSCVRQARARELKRTDRPNV